MRSAAKSTRGDTRIVRTLSMFVPEIDADELHETRHEKPGADEQHDGECDFGDQQDAAGALARLPCLSAPASLSAVARRGRENFRAGSSPKIRPVPIAAAADAASTRRSRPASASRGTVPGSDDRMQPDAPVRDGKSQQRSGRREDQAFSQHHARQLPAGRAERRANADVARPRRRASQHQVRHVDARDEQNEGHAPEKQEHPAPSLADDRFVERRDGRPIARRETSWGTGPSDSPVICAICA